MSQRNADGSRQGFQFTMFSKSTSATPMPTAERALYKWRELLTDFSARNPLLFFKPGRPGALALTNDPSDLYTNLAAGGRIDVRQLVPLQSPQGKLTPALKVEDVCTKLRRKAKTYVEETGLNPLMLAFDLCEWQDPTVPTGVARLCRAPLVLLPVILERPTGRGATYLRYDQGTNGHGSFCAWKYGDSSRDENRKFTLDSTVETASAVPELLGQSHSRPFTEWPSVKNRPRFVRCPQSPFYMRWTHCGPGNETLH